MKWLADYLHQRVLKLGVYSDSGTETGGGMPGRLRHEYQDALPYARWGIDYLKEDWVTATGPFEFEVPEDSYFVMGDNRNHSSDSRDSRLGTVDTRYVIGKAVFLAFPGPDERTGERSLERIGVIA